VGANPTPLRQNRNPARAPAMEKYEADLAKLKEILQTATDFKDVIGFFLDHLINHPEFIKAGSRTKNPMVRDTLKMIFKQLFKEEINMTHLLLLHIKKHKFYHGTCFANGNLANILYFEDLDVGMVGVLTKYRPNMLFARFTCYRVKVTDDNPIIAGGSSTKH
jgi:hypothetical protein